VEKSAVSTMIAAKQALDAAANELSAVGHANPRRDAELLLLHVLGIDRASLIAFPERSLSDTQLTEFHRLLTRRLRFEPLQYITGEREFYGLRLLVTPDVLIPRPETEHLVEAALERIPADQPFEIADVGTGSGAIAVAIAGSRPMAHVFALDISPGALKVAKTNAEGHGVADRITFLQSDLLAAVADQRFDMVVSNPPYIADSESDALTAEVRDYEPAQALFAGPTGIEVFERLVPQAARALRPEGWLLLEAGAGQDLDLRRLLSDWTDVDFVNDLQGIARVAAARSKQGNKVRAIA
jgi:release factor glutamine methyltransferase